MKRRIGVRLNVSLAQRTRLEALQEVFAGACNLISPIVQETRCWNRVALHHMAYRVVRDALPELGSQMACNAIYSVSQAARQVYQAPASPFNLARLGTRPLPLLQFSSLAPVYFDRHTLSLRSGELSMFTLDGRMRFQLGLTGQQEARFNTNKLRQIVLTRNGDYFVLEFEFHATGAASSRNAPDRTDNVRPSPALDHVAVVPPPLSQDLVAKHPTKRHSMP